MPAPIAFFAFNRPEHTRLTLAALSANALAAESELYIFCDGARSFIDEQGVQAVRQTCKKATGFASVKIFEQSVNQGVTSSIVTGVNWVLQRHDSVIVFEDDVLASPYTLKFLNEGLVKYEHEKSVFNIAAWGPDPDAMNFPADYPWEAYFTPRFHCWGWSTWKDRWEQINWRPFADGNFVIDPYTMQAFSCGGKDMPVMLRNVIEGKLPNAWDVLADFSRFIHGQVGLTPIRSYVRNIGHDGSGVHSGKTSIYDVNEQLAVPEPQLPDFIFISESLCRKYQNFLNGNGQQG